MSYNEASEALEALSNHQRSACLHYLLGALSSNIEFMEALEKAVDIERRCMVQMAERRAKAKRGKR